MTELWLIRHGETDWNVEGRWQGHADIPLNANGIAQAVTMAEKLQWIPFAAVYASDLIRARETAVILAKKIKLPVNREPRLREIDQGEWEGMLVGEIEARYAERFQQRSKDPFSVAPPGGETALQVLTRACAAIEDIVQSYPQEEVAVIGHGFVFALLRLHYQNLPKEKLWDLIPPNCEPYRLSVREEEVKTYRPAGLP